ncbi:MAG TPA: ABC transporter ATP-binding protein [Casimicrobiaceae bacterium]|nr:ABC transporter ATP-binding protein [Casimicrobiaceae bacterium]
MTDTAPALELVDIEKQFGLTPILRGLSLRVPSGERHAIIGPNGAGKSTLFNVVSGRFAPSRGSIRLHGRDVTGARPHVINRAGLSRSFQITNIFPRLSVFENVRCGVLWSLGHRYCFWRDVDKLIDARELARHTLDAIGLAGRADVPAGVLTYAEQRALEIGITVAGGASVILLDEPTSGMSRQEADRTVELIRRVSQGRTLLIVEHDMSVVFGLADRISVMVYGRIIASDAPARIRDNAEVQAAYLGDTFAAQEGAHA